MVRIFGNAVGWVANAAKLSSVGLCLNASKTESLLERRYPPWPLLVYGYGSTELQSKRSDGQVKSSVDDFASTGYCKHESSLCATICWGSTHVPRFVAVPQHGICEISRPPPILVILSLPPHLPISLPDHTVCKPPKSPPPSTNSAINNWIDSYSLNAHQQTTVGQPVLRAVLFCACVSLAGSLTFDHFPILKHKHIYARKVTWIAFFKRPGFQSTQQESNLTKKQRKTPPNATWNETKWLQVRPSHAEQSLTVTQPLNCGTNPPNTKSW